MKFASFLSCALLLFQFSIGSNSQEVFIDPTAAYDQEVSNPQEFFRKTKENNPGEVVIEKSKNNPQDSKTNPQEFFIETKFNPNFAEKAEVNDQCVFIHKNKSKHHHHNKSHRGHHHHHSNPTNFEHVFFKTNDLEVGKKLPIYFYTSDDSSPLNLLSKDEADSIPFSSSILPSLLQSLSIPNDSLQAEMMEDTLKDCEAKPKDGEFKFCATSLESMMEKASGFLGKVKLNALTTKILSSNHALFQNYTIVKKPLEINANKKVACHTMSYPYMVYYCHGHEGHSSKMYKLALLGDNGEKVEALAVCHMDTSTWSPNHVSFELIGGQPGVTPVCHILPTDNIAWIPST